MEVDKFFYYNLLKKSKIIVVVLGIIVVLMVVIYSKKFGLGIEETTTNSLIYCEEDSDCFEHCEKCVSIASAEVCENHPEVNCACIDTKCAVV